MSCFLLQHLLPTMPARLVDVSKDAALNNPLTGRYMACAEAELAKPSFIRFLDLEYEVLHHTLSPSLLEFHVQD
jgi:hypothetical protein